MAVDTACTEGDLDFLIWVWNPAVQGYSKAATSYKAQIATGTSPGGIPVPVPSPSSFASPPPVRPPGVLTRLFNQVSRIKLSPGYTDTIGQSLQVVGVPVAVIHPVPEYTLALKQGSTSQLVQINFTKFSHDGVWIESRRNGGVCEFLAIDTVKPYVDDRPLLVAATAETREYRMRWWTRTNRTATGAPSKRSPSARE